MKAAVGDNAAWCEAVCRSLGLRTSRTRMLWAVTDPPQWYPHRITLTSDAAAADALAGLPDGTQAWVKDSYATLDLAGDDFTPVVQACWIHRAPRSPVTTGGWSLVRSPDGLAGWATASGTAGVVTPPLLADPGVRFVGVLDGGRVVAGAALSCATDVVGVSDVFTDGPTPEETWDLVTAAATDLFPGRDLVGYEHGDDLEVACGAGFSPVGALRIWHRPVRSSARDDSQV